MSFHYRPPMPRIAPGQILSDEDARRVKAALALGGRTQKSFAADRGVSYDRLNRMVSRVERVTPAYAKILSELVDAAGFAPAAGLVPAAA